SASLMEGRFPWQRQGSWVSPCSDLSELGPRDPDKAGSGRPFVSVNCTTISVRCRPGYRDRSAQHPSSACPSFAESRSPLARFPRTFVSVSRSPTRQSTESTTYEWHSACPPGSREAE